MKKRACSILLVLALLLSMLPMPATVSAAANETIRLLNGTITKGELYNLFGGDVNTLGTTNYRYSLSDEIRWKRVNEEDKNSTATAENLQDGKVYTRQRMTYFLGESIDGSWQDDGTFAFQTYYEIGVVTEGEVPDGGSVTVTGGAPENGKYEVNKNDTLTLAFAQVEGYQAQVKVDSGAWLTLPETTYTHTADCSTTVYTRYVAAEEACKVTLTVNGHLLGGYSGLESDRVASGTEIALVVTPYNELTASGNDLDAYVKSVKVNGEEIPGTYANTVFTAEPFAVTEDTAVEITFAQRLARKAPTELHKKYPTDSEILMYSAKMNMDKKVSAQVPAIEASIIDSIVDKENTPGYENITIKLKGNLYLVGDIYMPLDGSALDAAGGYLDIIKEFLKDQTHWGDLTFHNDGETWEEIQLILPASADGRYPAVQTEDLTVWILEARTALNIEGTANSAVVESEANIDGAIKAAVNAKLFADNPGATLEKIGAGKITYSYFAPSFDTLLAETAREVEVTVTVAKGDHYLQSAGTITVPLYKASAEPRVTVTTDENGAATYTISENTYTLTLTPAEGYYVEHIEMVDTPESGDPVSAVISLVDMTVVSDGKYSYTYALHALDNHNYTLNVRFANYAITATATDGTLAYYDGMYEDTAALIAAIESEITKTHSHESFPAGSLYLEYNAGTNVWLSIGGELPNENCHAFGARTNETLRYRYVVDADGFDIISDQVTLTLSDGRIPTELKLISSKYAIGYGEYAALENKEEAILNALLDGVYHTGGEAPIKLENAAVTLEPSVEDLGAEDIKITFRFNGDDIYSASSATATLEITPLMATIAVAVNPKSVVYGTDYSMQVVTTPADLQTIHFAVGLDLEAMSISKQIIPLRMTVSGPENLCQTLNQYAALFAEDGVITGYAVVMALEQILEDSEAIKATGVSAASLEQLYTMLTVGAMYLADMPATVSEELPTDVGFYMVGAIVGQIGYEPQLAIDYLSITPIHHVAVLGWENDINSTVSFEQLMTDGFMDAKIVSIESGDMAVAEENLGWLYLGQNSEGQMQVLQKDELTEGVYTQVAMLKGWTENEQYSSVPITRQFALGVDYADVQFVDQEGQQTDSYFYEIPEDAQDISVTAPVTVDGVPVKPGTDLSYSYRNIESLLGGGDSGIGLPDAPGLFILQASYQKRDTEGKLTAAGKDSAIMAISMAIEGFDPKDTTVIFDGEPHFIQVEDSVGVPYFAVVADKTNKTINILLPEQMNELNEFLTAFSSFGELLLALQTFSAENAQQIALGALLRQVQADIQDVTGWTVLLDAARPSQADQYPVYVMTIANGLYLTKRTLTINKRDVVVTADALSKIYGEADPELTWTHNQVLAGSDSLVVNLSRQNGENVGAYSVTGTAEITPAASAGNYTVTVLPGSLTINPKELGSDAIVLTPAEIPYAGAAVKPAVSVMNGDKVVDASEYIAEIPEDSVNVGSYTVTVSNAEGGNYIINGSKTYEITKVPATVSAAPTANDLTYTGLSQNLVSPGETKDGILLYSLTENGTYGTDIPTGVNAGEYTVWYYVDGDDNHTDSEKNSVMVTIRKADPVIGVVSCDMTLYDSTQVKDVVLIRSVETVPGELLMTDAELTAGEKDYNWKFTPEDGDNYNTITGTVKLNVIADVLEEINASGTLEKDRYVYGDTFSIAGLTVTATYTSGITKDVTELVGFDSALAVGQTAVELTYQDKTCAVSGITVAKKQLDVSHIAWTIPTNAVYNNTAYTATLSGEVPEGVKVDVSGNTGTNAGNYTAMAKFSLAEGYSTDNYEIVNGGDLTAQWSIAKADAPVITFPEVLNAITYGQSMQNAELSFYSNDYGTFNWAAPMGVPNAGTAGYALDFYPNDLMNYDWAGTAQNAIWVAERNALCGMGQVVVNKADAKVVTAPSAITGLVYNGQAQELISIHNIEVVGGKLMLSRDSSAYSETIPAETNAGTYTVWYKVAGDSNHNDTTSECITVIIDKADPVYTIPSDLTATYGDTLKEVALPAGWTWTDETLPVGNVGINTFLAYYTPEDNANYNVVEDISISVAVGKADAVYEAPAAVADLIYNGNGQKLVTAGEATGGVMQYSLDGENYSVEVPTGTNAGSYTVWYKVVGDSNHKDVAPQSVTTKISPKEVTSLTFEKLNQVYVHTGSAIEPTFTVKDGVTALTKDTDYTVTYSNNTDVGTATITVTLQNNYSGTVTKTFEIRTHGHDWSYKAEGATILATCNGEIGICPVPDKTVTIELNAPADLRYDGKAKTVTVTQTPEDIFELPDVVYIGDCKSTGDHTAKLTYGNVTAALTFTITCEHSYTAGEYIWSGDDTVCSVIGTCACGDTVSAAATVTSRQSKAPTCSEKGETTYTATFTEDWAQTQTKTVENVPATGAHNYVAGEYVWNAAGTSCTVTGTCVCGITDEASATVKSEQTKAPTCISMGETTYTATFDETWAATQATTREDVPFSSHTEGDPVEENRVDATCTEKGSYDLVIKCTVCGTELSRETKTIPPAHKDADGDGFCDICGDGKITAITEDHVTVTGKFTYNASAQVQNLTVTVEGKTLTEGVDYYVAGNTGINAGTYTLQVNGSGKYAGKVEFTWSIAPAEATVTVHNAQKVYGEKDPAFQYEVAGLQGDDRLDITVTRAKGENAGKYAVTATVKENGNYRIAVQNGELTVAEREISLILNSFTREFDQPLPEKWTYSIVSGTVVSGDTLKLKITCNTVTTTAWDYTVLQKPVECHPIALGNYAITATDADPNYKISIQAGQLSVVKVASTPMYRLYNSVTGEHHYTGSQQERDDLVKAGWEYEGVAWNAPIYIGDPIHRVYNPETGEHHYSGSMKEIEDLMDHGWKYEGVAWNSAPPTVIPRFRTDIPQYRVYNPNATVGSHHYTGSWDEVEDLVDQGWEYEGIAWYSLLY